MRKALAVLMGGLSAAACGSVFAKTETVTGQVIATRRIALADPSPIS